MSRLHKKKSIIMIAMLAIIIVVIVTLTTGSRNQVSGPESLVGSVFKPFTSLAARMVNFTRNSVSNIAEMGSLREKNKLLNQQVITLKAQVREVETLRQENQRLREMLDFKNTHSEFELVGASIIGKDPSNIFSMFIIDKGESSGIHKNMPVVTNKGLVGHVMETGSNWAKVLPICDQRSSVSIIINRTRDAGILKGNNNFKLEAQISPEAAVIEEDEVITSGMGGVYPKGLVVGEVSHIQTDTSLLLKVINVEPAVDFEKLEEVFILDYSAVFSAEGEIGN